MILIIIKHVLLAVAQSRSLPGAPVVGMSPDESHDESPEESDRKEKREREKRKRMCNLKGALAGS